MPDIDFSSLNFGDSVTVFQFLISQSYPVFINVYIIVWAFALIIRIFKFI